MTLLPVATAYSLVQVGAAVQITEGTFEDRPQFIIHTEHATWFYDRAGGGFSRLIDRDGRDWIAFSKNPLTDFPAAAAAGFRGIPNSVFIGPDKGAGHPGFDRCASELAAPNQIRTRSLSGQWQWSWTFTADTARLVMEKADPEHPWWFLCEGPVAGRFAPTQQYWGTDTGGPQHDVPDIRNQRFGQWRWAYFGDRSLPRTLFVAQHELDALDDTFWYLGSSDGGAATSPDGMVVLGFGRGPGTRPLFRGAGQRFTLGLLEMGVTSSADHAALGARIEAAVAGRVGEQAPPRGIEVWHGQTQRFGHVGEAQAWVNVLGRVSPASEIAAFTCQVNQSPPQPLTLGTDLHRLARRGDFKVELSWDDLRPETNTLTLTARYHDGAILSTNVTHFGVALRWRGHTADGRQPSRRWYPLGAQGELLLTNDPEQCRWRVLPGPDSGLPITYAAETSPVPLEQPIEIRAQVQTLENGRTRYRFKHWTVGAPEPAGWAVEAFKPPETAFPSGSLCLVPHNSDVTIHQVTVEPIGPTRETQLSTETEPHSAMPCGGQELGCLRGDRPHHRIGAIRVKDAEYACYQRSSR